MITDPITTRLHQRGQTVRGWCKEKGHNYNLLRQFRNPSRPQRGFWGERGRALWVDLLKDGLIPWREAAKIKRRLKLSVEEISEIRERRSSIRP